MRAVIERHGEAAKSYPKIQTLIVKGKEDLSIRITDHGGGIPHSKLSQVFKYMYSTAPKPSLDSDVYSASSNAPLVCCFILHFYIFYIHYFLVNSQQTSNKMKKNNLGKNWRDQVSAKKSHASKNIKIKLLI